jgi:formylmethanofuran dehydrogenase subunit C
VDGARIGDGASIVDEFGVVVDCAAILDGDCARVVYGTIVIDGAVAGDCASIVVSNGTIVVDCASNAPSGTVVNDGTTIVEDAVIADFDTARVDDDPIAVVESISNCQRDVKKN